MFADLLQSKLAGVCELSEAQVERLQRHYELLTRWNSRMSLTSVRSVEEAVERHYCESVFAAKQLPVTAVSIGDIGSGAGFPGIPIAIMRPDCEVSLIESNQRKATFLRESVRDLANVRVVGKRAEDIGKSFDWAVSRAVRYSDIVDALTKLAENAELLTGAVQTADLPGFIWQEPIRLPWGERRYLWIGSRDVSCETAV